MGCTRVLECVEAAAGLLDQVPVRFEPARDVPGAGVLCALPALLENGLLKYTEDNHGNRKTGDKKMARYIQKKSDLLDTIQNLQADLQTSKNNARQHPDTSPSSNCPNNSDS